MRLQKIIKSGKYLLLVSILLLSANTASGVKAAVLGDCNTDNRVDVLDFQLLSNTFGKTQGQSGYNPACDFNTDTRIDILDFQVLSNNFGRLGVTPTSGPTPPNGTHITYAPISDDIANPERGFYRQANIQVDQPYSGSNIGTRQATDTLVWVYFHLENYRDPRDGPGVTLSNYQGKLLEPIGSGKGLDTVNRTFADARSKGLKLVIRFLYLGYSGIGSNSNPSTSQPDAPLSLVQQHLNQLAPLFEQNKDVISAFQFGFVGYWGEWHSSKYLYSNDARRGVMSAMLAATPRDRMVELRYPRYKQAFYGGPLTDSQAYNQSDLARIGYHDDAFLKDSTDDGTYRSSAGGTQVTPYCNSFPGGEEACWRDYVGKDSKHVAVSGEAGTHSSTPSTYALCPNAIPAMENFHFNSIHNGYSQVTLNAWTTGGCMPEIRRRFGYRFELIDANIPLSVSRGQAFNLNVNIKNSGFGNLYNPRTVYAVLTGSSGRFEIPLPSVEPRRWDAGRTTAVNTSLTIPVTVPSGTYSLSLWLPDASNTIKNNIAYMIRFANANTWSNGLNVLTTNFRVQ